MLPAPDPIEIGDPTSGEGNKTDYRAVRSAEDLRSLEQCLAKADVCAIDTETSGKDPRTALTFTGCRGRERVSCVTLGGCQ